MYVTIGTAGGAAPQGPYGPHASGLYAELRQLTHMSSSITSLTHRYERGINLNSTHQIGEQAYFLKCQTISLTDRLWM